MEEFLARHERLVSANQYFFDYLRHVQEAILDDYGDAAIERSDYQVAHSIVREFADLFEDFLVVYDGRL